jgi:hypothetical protein
MLLLACALITTAFLSRESTELEHARPTLQRALAVQALIFWLSVGFSAVGSLAFCSGYKRVTIIWYERGDKLDLSTRFRVRFRIP